MEQYHHVTQHISSISKGSEIGAFFDFDGTIIEGYSAFIFIREQVKKGHISPRGFVETVAALVNHQIGTLDFSGLLDVGAQVLEGVDENKYREFSEKVYQKYIKAVVYPEARELIKAHQAKGHTVAIVSTATPYQVQSCADELGIEHVYCSNSEIVNGKFSGKTLGEPCWGQGKVNAVHALAASKNIDLFESCFYSDSDDDIAALECVGIPRVVNPNEGLRTIANSRGWPVQEFARTGKPSLFEKIRTVGVHSTLIGSYFAGMGVWRLNGSKDEGRRFMLSLFTDISFALIGGKLSIKNPENITAKQPALVIFNHQSQADGLLLMKLFKDNFSAIGKKELGRFKLFAKAHEFAGIIPIDRENSASAIEAMRPLVNTLTVEKRNVLISPEGTRSTSKMPGPFKKGAFHVAMQAGVPILPVVIHNAIDLQPKGQFAYRPGTIEIEVLEPIETTDWTKETLDVNIAKTRNLFLSKLGFDEEPLPESKVAKPKAKPKKKVKPAAKLTPK